jgi:hypothetical protein
MATTGVIVSQATGTGTSNVVFTHNLGSAPKLALLWVSRKGGSTGLNTGSGISFSYGMTDGTRQGRCCTGASGGGTEELSTIATNVSLLLAQNDDNGFAGFPSKCLRFSAWTTTTATFTQTDFHGVGENWTVHALFLTGSDIANVYVGTNQHEVTATNTTFTIAEPPFTPHFVIGCNAGMITGADATTNPDGFGAGSQTQLGLGLGISDFTNNFCTHQAGFNGSVTTSQSLVRTDSWLQNGLAEAGTSTVRQRLTMESADTNGFTVRRFETGDTSYQTYFVYAAVRMSNAAYFKVGTFATQGSTGTFNLATTGMDPKVMLAFGDGKATVGSATYASEAKLCFGMAAGASQVGGGFVHDDGSTCGTWNSTTAMLENFANATTHTKSHEIQLDSFGSEQVVLDQVSGTASGVLFGYLILGEAPASSSETLATDAGTIAIAGSNVGFNYSLACEAGVLSIDGVDAALTSSGNQSLVCDAGTLAIAGVDMTAAATESGDIGTLAIAGSDIIFGLSVACEAGIISLSGIDVSFIDSGNQSYSLACDMGVLSLSGFESTLLTPSSGDDPMPNRRRRFK